VRLAGFAAAAFAAALMLICCRPGVASPPRGEPVHGIRCDAMEATTFHIHQHLAVFNHGKPVPVPEDVGRPLAGCFYWLHTHTPDGIIHVEAPAAKSYTLGDFFAIWGQPLTATNVAGATLKKGEKLTVWVNGSRVTTDPAKIELANHTDITIDVGPPAPKPAPFTAWGDL
jgi:hypothetical protein